jgi:hypothetical protein
MVIFLYRLIMGKKVKILTGDLKKIPVQPLLADTDARI